MKRTLCIIGSPFCGTTLIGFLLGDHPQVVNIGEFYCRYAHHYPKDGFPGMIHMWFESRPLGAGFCIDRARCRMCKRNPCSMWDDYSPCPPQNIYAHVRNYVHADCVVDVSKMGQWYKHALAVEDDTSDVLLVVVHKEPWGFLASVQDYRREGPADVDSEEFARQQGTFWASHYRVARSLAEEGIDVKNVPYETFARQPKAVIKGIYECAGLGEHEPSLLCEKLRQQHPVDGNYKLCEKILTGSGPLPISEDRRGDRITPRLRHAMLDGEGVREMREWLGR